MILLVEDDELVRDFLGEVLKDAGYEVVETGDPYTALGLPDAIGPPTIVITDIDLGSALNGFGVAASAHQLWPDVRVILISAYPRARAGQSLDRRDRYIQKPFSGPYLLEAIGQLGNVST
jgi:CheY-like chemotaxis protein